MGGPQTPQPLASVRADVWLWAARLYKTRALCKAAIEAGAVRINGQRIKPSRDLTAGMCLAISQGQVKRTIMIQALSKVRQSASLASVLYAETAESITQRAQQQAQRALAPPIGPASKPSKQQRRAHSQFVERNL